jgi:hypothetical protein
LWNFIDEVHLILFNHCQQKKPKKPKTEKVDFDSIHTDFKEIWDNLEKQPHFEASWIDTPDGLIMIDLG